MKTRIFNLRLAVVSSLIVCMSLAGCDYFRNPLDDKETGETVKLLVVDFNFIKTKIAFHLKDMDSNEYIDNEEIELFFLGEDAGNVITFTGTKPDHFTTEAGFLEIGIDPNVVGSAANPINLSVVAVSEHHISAPIALSYTTEGIKDVLIKMISIGSMKSGLKAAYDEPFDIKYNGVLNSAQLAYFAAIGGLPTGTAYEYLNLYITSAASTLVAENITDAIVYPDYGVYYFDGTSGSELVPPANPTKNVALGTNYNVYSSVLRSGIEKCDDGLTIGINSTDGSVGGSGSFNYWITYSDGSKDEGIVSGSFPIVLLVDNIYYPSTNPAVSVQVFEDSQYNISAPVSLNDPCGAEAIFIARKKSGLNTYKFIIRYTCPNLPATVALTIGGEFRKTGDTGDWTRYKFEEGIAALQLRPNSQYDFRINIDGVNYEYSLPTDPTNLDQFLRDNQDEEFYKITTLTITDSGSLVTINAEVQLSGDVCDILN